MGNRNMYLVQVCKLGKRPALEVDWSQNICDLIHKAWAQDQYNRIAMVDVCAHLERIEKQLQELAVCVNETKPLFQRASKTFVPSIIRRKSNTLVPFVPFVV